MAELFGHNNRGLLNGDIMAVVREAKETGTKMAMLAEFGFHDTKTDADYMIANRKLIAAWEGEIIARHMALPLIPKVTIVEDTAGQVQTTSVDAPYGYVFVTRSGSYKKRVNAEAQKAKLIDKGFADAYIELVPYSKEK